MGCIYLLFCNFSLQRKIHLTKVTTLPRGQRKKTHVAKGMQEVYLYTFSSTSFYLFKLEVFDNPEKEYKDK